MFVVVFEYHERFLHLLHVILNVRQPKNEDCYECQIHGSRECVPIQAPVYREERGNHTVKIIFESNLFFSSQSGKKSVLF